MGEDDRHGIAIIGAGFGGIGMAIRLKRAGIHDFVILEKAAELGGTWRDNTYPGAACDVPSHLYSFSFERKTDWSRRLAPQAEIHDYLRQCADRHGLDAHIRYNCEVGEARFDDRAAQWTLSTDRGRVCARVLISACGQLNRPAVPDIAGAHTFAGDRFHSARWDHDVELTGRRVAVIGTGASAVQFVPYLAERAARLHVYQRTPPYVVDKPDREYTALEHALLRTVPGLYALSRGLIYLGYESRAVGFVKYPAMMKLLRRRFEKNLRAHVADLELRAALQPDYPAGCKRILLSDDYYPALARPDVELVTDPIDRITARGVRTADGIEREADAIVYGTGFRSTEFLAPMKVVGLDDRELNEEWRDGAEAHLGIVVSGFPNMFLLYGPNTNLGHNSIIYMLESQFRYILGCLEAIRRHGLAWIDVRPDVQHAFNRELQQRMRSTVWDAGCASWYITASGKHSNNWPGFTFAYRRATRRPDPRHFRVRRRAAG